MPLIHLNDQNFVAEVLDFPGKVLVDFWAPWCGPCQMLTPIIEEIANTPNASFKVAKLNTDESPQTAGKYNITAIPSVLIFNNGQVVNSLVGFRQKQDYLDALK